MSKPKETILASAFNKVWIDLQNTYKDISLEGLAKQSKLIESSILSMVVSSMIDYFKNMKTFKQLKTAEFMLDNTLYVIRYGPRISEPILEICILDAIHPKQDSNTSVEKIVGIGFYESFELILPNKLRAHIEPLTHLIKEVFNAGYGWLKKSFNNNLAQMEKSFVKELYSYSRAALTNSGRDESLAEEIWFSVWNGKNGYYVLDSQVINAILQLLERRAFTSDLSPVEHVIEIIRLEEPFNKSISRYAIKDNTYRELELIKADYVADLSNIYKTEVQMVKGSMFAVFPFGKVGSYHLCAGFPSRLKEVLVPFFEANKIQIIDIYRKESKTLAYYLDRVKPTYPRITSPEFWGSAGAFAGGIIKSFLPPGVG